MKLDNGRTLGVQFVWCGTTVAVCGRGSCVVHDAGFLDYDSLATHWNSPNSPNSAYRCLPGSRSPSHFFVELLITELLMNRTRCLTKLKGESSSNNYVIRRVFCIFMSGCTYSRIWCSCRVFTTEPGASIGSIEQCKFYILQCVSTVQSYESIDSKASM